MKVIEFLILVICIAAACGIIVWTVRCDNKTNNKNNEPKDKK